MLHKVLTSTHPKLTSFGVLLLRITIGLILFVIGAGKVFGWFGGMGLEKTVQAFVSMMHISAALAYLSCIVELIGGFLLLLGLFTRPAAIAVAINMLVATIVTLPQGFFMGKAAYPFCLLMISIAILLTGPMEFSLDHWLVSRKS